jgi:hypothetical protein
MVDTKERDTLILILHSIGSYRMDLMKVMNSSNAILFESYRYIINQEAYLRFCSKLGISSGPSINHNSSDSVIS